MHFYARKQLLLSARLSHRNSVRPSVRLSVSPSVRPTVTRVERDRTLTPSYSFSFVIQTENLVFVY